MQSTWQLPLATRNHENTFRLRLTHMDSSRILWMWRSLVSSRFQGSVLCRPSAHECLSYSCRGLVHRRRKLANHVCHIRTWLRTELSTGIIFSSGSQGNGRFWCVQGLISDLVPTCGLTCGCKYILAFWQQGARVGTRVRTDPAD